MDGYGLRDNREGNAVYTAKKPHIDFLWNNYPHTQLQASEEYVGLPKGQMGNSEVGHMNIGAGRIVYQSLTYVTKEIKSGDFFKNETLIKAINHSKKNNSSLHLFGLVSDGGVHSHIEHLYALLELCKQENFERVFVHAFMDGRDVPPQSGPLYIHSLLNKMAELKVGQLASIHGRYYAMDRDKNFNRFDISYKVLTELKGNSYSDVDAYFKNEYEVNLPAKEFSASDEFLTPSYDSRVKAKISDNDAIICFNFRPDRAIQIGTIFTNPLFYSQEEYDENKELKYKPYTPNVILKNIEYVCFMKYAESVKGDIAFELPPLHNILGEVLASKGYHQLRIAETEKYAHVTFFFDGTKNFDGVERAELKNCDRILVHSPKVATYDLKPEMSAYEVTEKLLVALDKKIYDVVILNFANCDMVGHTAIFEAIVKAVETVDNCVGQIYNKLQELGGVLLLTADHGNSEYVYDEFGNPVTSHTTNPVPFIVTDKSIKLVDGGKLGDIAPTILTLLGEPVSLLGKVDGKSLIK
jgi:2,3-bisphosphoglycerate-independent phosphoglycerate mutase